MKYIFALLLIVGLFLFLPHGTANACGDPCNTLVEINDCLSQDVSSNTWTNCAASQICSWSLKSTACAIEGGLDTWQNGTCIDGGVACSVPSPTPVSTATPIPPTPTPFGQSTQPPAFGCWYIGNTPPNSPGANYECSLNDFGPVNNPITSPSNGCTENGSNTGTYCCSTYNAYCAGVQVNVARNFDLYCCPNAAPTPTIIPTGIPPTATPIPPTPTPTPALGQFVLSGTVWIDTNRNGAQDAGETVYSGATVTLSGTVDDTRTTGGGGSYAWLLNDGNYSLSVSASAPEYTPTTTNPVSISGNISSNLTVNFGLALPPSPTATPIPGTTPTPTPIPTSCSMTDSDGNGWYETCSGAGGPISDICSSLTSYKYAGCNASDNINFSCSYAPSSSCGFGLQCSVNANTGKPECYDPGAPTATPTPTPIGGGGTPTPNPTPTDIPPPVFYTISGKIFTDANRDGLSAGDANYQGAFSVSSTGGVVSYPGSGTFQISNLPAGSYTITFGGLTSGYRFTYPETSGNALIVNVGSPCSCPGNSEATCSLGGTCTSGGLGSIANLNAGVTDIAKMWFQSIGSDIRWDSASPSLDNPIPAGKYASIARSGGMPGIIFSGGKNGLSAGLGAGSASAVGWKVGSFAHPDVFTASHNLITSSYEFLLDTAEDSGIIPKPITSSTSSLSEVTAHNIYKKEGNLNVDTAYVFSTNQNFIILIDGDLNINANITVPVGSTAIFSAKGDITVGAGVTEIQGLYSADGTFTVEGVNSCIGNPTVVALNVAGSVIANAGRGGGRFSNKRDLCGGASGNAYLPSVTFTERPDFLLNYPLFVQQINRIWQEVAP